jgi:hypothetical protein
VTFASRRFAEWTDVEGLITKENGRTCLHVSNALTQKHTELQLVDNATKDDVLRAVYAAESLVDSRATVCFAVSKFPNPN